MSPITAESQSLGRQHWLDRCQCERTHVVLTQNMRQLSNTRVTLKDQEQDGERQSPIIEHSAHSAPV